MIIPWKNLGDVASGQEGYIQYNNGSGTITSNSNLAFDGTHLYSGNIKTDIVADVAAVGSTGTQGEIRFSSTHLYVCIATDTWRRSALSTW